MAARGDTADAPEAFRAALASLHATTVRPEVVLAEAAAPQRLAPWSVALSADVLVAGEEVASGRLVLLHDPTGHDAWEGTFRLVTFIRVELEAEMAADPLLPGVGWAWLLEALAEREVPHVAVSGTVTRVASESFGAMAARPASAEMELRASWTPLDTELGPHLSAWSELLCTAAGLPPVSADVAVLPGRWGARRR